VHDPEKWKPVFRKIMHHQAHDPEKWKPVFRKIMHHQPHDPEKWKPVIRKDHAPPGTSNRFDLKRMDSIDDKELKAP
jgi:hypothetical protein